MSNHISHNKKGFTLVELLVSVFIFSIVMTISIGAVLMILDTNRKAQSLKSVMSNLNFAVENMSRNIKVSTTIKGDGGDGCFGSGVSSLILNEDDDIDDNDITYKLSDNQVLISSQSNDFVDVPVTASEVRVDVLCFFVSGEGVGDVLQPKVTMLIKGIAGDKAKTQSEFEIQTTVSKRVLQN